MSFWGTLAKIGGFAGAPFTGGASIPIGMSAGSAIDSISKGTGNASQAMASNRGTEASMMMNQNSSMERELLARQQEKRDSRNDAYKNAIRGSIATNYDPNKLFSGLPAGVPHIDITGGTMGNEQAKAAGRELSAQSMNRLTQPDLQVDGGGGMPTYRNLWTDPQFQKLLRPGKMEKFLGYTSAFAPIVGLGIGAAQGGSDSGSGGYEPNDNNGWG
jgi:hypothetical protein